MYMELKNKIIEIVKKNKVFYTIYYYSMSFFINFIRFLSRQMKN